MRFLSFLLCVFPLVQGFQSMINEKCKIPLLDFLDLEIPTMTITIAKEENSAPPKLCKDCVHYRKNIFAERYDMGSHSASCVKFREVNLVSGITENMNVMDARKSEKYCGKRGKHFEKRARKVMRNNAGHDDEDDDKTNPQ